MFLISTIFKEHELSADLITFHQAVSQLQIMEDELLECHARVTDESEKWLELDRRFLTHTAEVDYDQEGTFTCVCLFKDVKSISSSYKCFNGSFKIVASFFSAMIFV